MKYIIFTLMLIPIYAYANTQSKILDLKDFKFTKAQEAFIEKEYEPTLRNHLSTLFKSMQAYSGKMADSLSNHEAPDENENAFKSLEYSYRKLMQTCEKAKAIFTPAQFQHLCGALLKK